jgi:uncharacterized protein
MPQQRIAGLMRWILRAFPDHPVDPSISETGITDDLVRQDIVFFFNYVYPLKPEETESLNDFNHELEQRLPAAAPFGSLHLDTPNKEAVIRRCLDDYRFVGLKFHPFVQRFNPADEKMMGVYEMMEHYGRPVVLHTGFEEFYRMKMPPEDIEKILRRYPRLVLVLAHCLFPSIRRLRALMEEFEGVWIDATNVFGVVKYMDTAGSVIKTSDGNYYGDRFRSLMTDFSDRALFGSDHPVGMGDLATIYRDFSSSGLSATVAQAVLWDNPLLFIARFAPHIRERWERMIRPVS